MDDIYNDTNHMQRLTLENMLTNFFRLGGFTRLERVYRGAELIQDWWDNNIPFYIYVDDGTQEDRKKNYEGTLAYVDLDRKDIIHIKFVRCYGTEECYLVPFPKWIRDKEIASQAKPYWQDSCINWGY